MIIHTHGTGHVYRGHKLLLSAVWASLLQAALVAKTDQPLTVGADLPDQQDHISIICKEQPLKWILSQFESQSGLSFVYSNDDLDVNRKYSVAVRKMKVNDALYKIFSPLKLRYEIAGDKILLRAVPPVPTTTTLPSGSPKDTATGVIVKGKVLDEKGNPLAGVSVEWKNEGLHTITDNAGNFQLKIPRLEGTLSFSYVGYEIKEVAVSSADLTIALSLLDKAMGGVVVVGYGTQKKVSLSGGGDVIRSSSPEGRATPNLSHALPGGSPQLTIHHTSFEPGQSVNINIRGIGTLGKKSH